MWPPTPHVSSTAARADAPGAMLQCSRKGAALINAMGWMRMLSAVATVSSIVCGAVPARADVMEQTKKVGGVTVHYKVVLPAGYDATKTYPAIIALGGGPQTMNTVDGML